MIEEQPALFLPPLLACINDQLPEIRTTAEGTLAMILDLEHGTSKIERLIPLLDSSSSKRLLDYYRRMYPT
jgi:hypothetical protein